MKGKGEKKLKGIRPWAISWQFQFSLIIDSKTNKVIDILPSFCCFHRQIELTRVAQKDSGQIHDGAYIQDYKPHFPAWQCPNTVCTVTVGAHQNVISSITSWQPKMGALRYHSRCEEKLWMWSAMPHTFIREIIILESYELAMVEKGGKDVHKLTQEYLAFVTQ